MFVKLDRRLCCVNNGHGQIMEITMHKKKYTENINSTAHTSTVHTHIVRPMSHACAPLNSLSDCSRETDGSTAAPFAALRAEMNHLRISFPCVEVCDQ